MNNECAKKSFLTALKKYENEGKAFLMECGSNCSDASEYIGAVKSGKSIYFAFINKDSNSVVKESDLNKFKEKAKKFFDMGGATFVVLSLGDKTYRIPYFILDSLTKNGQISVAESEISRFEFKSNETAIPFLDNDVFECTIAGKSFFYGTKA